MIKILHVDDDQATLELTRLHFDRVAPQIEVISCESAEEALVCLEGARFDCVISDLDMPNIDGLNLLKNLRDDGNDTPFIFLTGSDSADTKLKAEQTGANGYHTKDPDPELYKKLANRIQEIVDTFGPR